MRQRGKQNRRTKTPPNLPLKGRLNNELVFIIDIFYIIFNI
jgi:hypothetical protein